MSDSWKLENVFEKIVSGLDEDEIRKSARELGVDYAKIACSRIREAVWHLNVRLSSPPNLRRRERELFVHALEKIESICSLEALIKGGWS
ncbi:hypothetical protein IY145_10885 [Methylosinus sp. H3A]|uniref:hypothetical protein n=1 Tax=Methylosinus sp. H3A TaxID=2785786 RepID=UPI0018C28572|nr:hypothetical protein [Methylosinus sp. H3A]MBG0809884.1 hypothetical protein [Methylosinus sp. H3A]